MKLRRELEATVKTLLAGVQAHGGREVSLNDVAKALGVQRVTPPEIEAIFARLEAAGLVVTSIPVGSLFPLLGQVVRAARRRRDAGEPSHPRVLAEELGVAESEVRAALLLASTLG